MGEKILTIKLTETLLNYDPAELEKWKNGDLGMLPANERSRLSKYRNQCHLGYHFAEVCVMRELEKEGFVWYYENYKIFEKPGTTSRVFQQGYAAAIKRFGIVQILELQSLSSQYSSQKPDCTPKEPDLFALHKTSDTVRFIEVKRDDPVVPGQLLALALIREILKCSVEIIRLVPRRSTVTPKSYGWTFEPKRKESWKQSWFGFVKF
jgi:hypothetical protein